MNVVLLAGGEVSPNDPLFTQAPFGKRSLVDIYGKPMVQWVLDALCASEFVDHIYIVGLGQNAGLTATKPTHFLADQGGLFENIRAGTLKSSEDHPGNGKVIIVAADIPAIQPEMVQWLVQKVEQNPDKLLYYSVVSRETMDARFPDAGRSYVRFRDVTVCGGDMNVIDPELFKQDHSIWKKLTEARKSPAKQMLLLGIDSLILVMLNRLTLDGAVKKVCNKLSINASALLNPFAEVGMDADKLHQLEILRRDLDPQQ